MRSARWVYTAQFVGAAVLITAGIVLRQPFAVVLGVVDAIGGPIFVYLSRKRMRAPHGDVSVAKPGARRLTPTALPPLSAAGTLRWIGGCNVPGSFGRMNASAPLAVLLAGPGSARIIVRPKVVARLFGVHPHTYVPSENTTAFAVQGFMTRGVGFQESDAAPSYFWTTKPSQVLSGLAGCGFTVKWELAKPKRW